MEPEQILKTCHRYRHLINSIGINNSIRAPSGDKYLVDLDDQNSVPDWTQPLEHALWMCDEIEFTLLTAGQVGKAERWLCFIQGILWMTGLCSIDEMRDDNRG
jgi:hypothetical protein